RRYEADDERRDQVSRTRSYAPALCRVQKYSGFGTAEFPVKCRERHLTQRDPHWTRSVRVLLAENDTNKVGGILGAEFHHDMCAVHFNSAGTESEMTSRFLVGRRGGDFGEHLPLARGEPLRSRKIHVEPVRIVAFRRTLP